MTDMFRVLLLLAVFFYTVETTLATIKAPVKCDNFNENLCWTLDECFCRPFQNACFRDAENQLRLKHGKRPLVPVTKELCKHYAAKNCGVGRPVIATFAKIPNCGCRSKATLIQKRFKNMCFLKKHTVDFEEAYLSVKYAHC